MASFGLVSLGRLLAYFDTSGERSSVRNHLTALYFLKFFYLLFRLLEIGYILLSAVFQKSFIRMVDLVNTNPFLRIVRFRPLP